MLLSCTLLGRASGRFAGVDALDKGLCHFTQGSLAEDAQNSKLAGPATCCWYSSVEGSLPDALGCTQVYRKLVAALVICFVFMIIEVVGGFIANRCLLA